MNQEIEHPSRIQPQEHAVTNPTRMGKSTIFQSDRLLVGLNCLEAGQEHALHAHSDMDKVYLVSSGVGQFLLDEREIQLNPGEMLVAPADVPHGVRNDGPEQLLVLVFLAPSP